MHWLKILFESSWIPRKRVTSRFNSNFIHHSPLQETDGMGAGSCLSVRELFYFLVLYRVNGCFDNSCREPFWFRWSQKNLITWNFRDTFIWRFWRSRISRHLNFAILENLIWHFSVGWLFSWQFYVQKVLRF